MTLPMVDGTAAACEQELGAVDDARADMMVSVPEAVVLVEGASDVAAVHALARRAGVVLDGRVEVVDIGGATNIGRAVAKWNGVTAFGVCDVNEVRYFRRAFSDPARVFVCDRDLEDELIRALGVDAVQDVIEQANELDSFRRFQRQPAQRDRQVADQMHRFLGTKSGRKIRYGTLLVEALGDDQIRTPLADLLAALGTNIDS